MCPWMRRTSFQRGWAIHRRASRDVNKQYSPLNVILDMMIENNPEDVRTNVQTQRILLYTAEQENASPRRHSRLYYWMESLPSMIQIPVACIGVCAKSTAKFLATGLPLFPTSPTSCVRIE